MKNPLKEKLRAGQAVLGTFVSLGHPDVTERLARAGFDWMVLDAEHSPMEFETLQILLQSLSGTDCIPIVRPQWNDPVTIKRVLDIGAYGVLIPWVNSKEEAEAAVRACQYPPHGIRGYGPRRANLVFPDYYATANQEIMVVAQIETAKALRNVDDILAVEGIDACYIGPYYLSSDMGLGIPPQWDNPRYLDAFDHVLKAAAKHGKPAGMLTSSSNIEWALEKGFRFNTVGSADDFLMTGARLAMEAARSAKARLKSP